MNHMHASSLVLRLQLESASSDTPVSTALRTAKLISVKARLPEDTLWINLEIEGYIDVPLRTLPEYRRLRGVVHAKDPHINHWRPISIESEEAERWIAVLPLSQSVTELEVLLESLRGKNSEMLAYPRPLRSPLQRMHPGYLEFALEFPVSSIAHALSSVRNKLLNWSLDIEQRGVTVVDESATTQRKAEPVYVTNNHFHHPQTVQQVNNVSGGSTVSQVISTAESYEEIRNLLRQFESIREAIPHAVREPLQEVIAELSREMESKVPSPPRVRTILETLKTVGEGAAGNLLASGIASMAGAILPLLPIW